MPGAPLSICSVLDSRSQILKYSGFSIPNTQILSIQCSLVLAEVIRGAGIARSTQSDRGSLASLMGYMQYHALYTRSPPQVRAIKLGTFLENTLTEYLILKTQPWKCDLNTLFCISLRGEEKTKLSKLNQVQLSACSELDFLLIRTLERFCDFTGQIDYMQYRTIPLLKPISQI